MHRDGLFFDPLQDEADAPPAAPEPARHRRPSAEELQVQRQRELARVQDELKRMARGSRRR
ncbi:hypothetical protein [Arthrobacter burdickii]|jgi:hypothetical protein|uniref:Uncharacterized protein n=1 Tax=Arthrobacter burdickii TaxID=3035920 RepID=A0ABT8JWB3_9MICC|nr:hypothetical protein [Arthrobacter burdickii]MDN4609461.1 hypothetical protein [Arthrobacter burdickii]